ncbi:MAG TPA: DUF3014 domain-containing protein [Anaeromyxobacteraceae bacterium]|nr:DUF3014 domain-containing protein [Anaeromyxobacteraceae bacterium]
MRKSSRVPWIALGLIVVTAIGGAIFLWFPRGTVLSSPPGPPSPAVATTPPPAAPAGPAPTVEPQRARSLLESISPSPLFQRWLGEGDLIRRWAVVTDNLAEGVSPRKQLRFLAPAGAFSVETRGQQSAISQASYQRYDEIAEAIGSIDVQALAKVYRELHPVLEGAYRALGYPDGVFDNATARALQRISAAPVREGDVLVELREGVFICLDHNLERLGDIEKHLLRMGPRNTRILRAKAREIAQALGMATGPATATSDPAAGDGGN